MFNFNLNTNNIKVQDLFYQSLKVGLILLLLYYFIIMVYNIIKSFSFYTMGDQFNKDFIINIRTNDASDDCNIKGRFKNDTVEKISIQGDGMKCSKLRSNNKL